MATVGTVLTLMMACFTMCSAGTRSKEDETPPSVIDNNESTNTECNKLLSKRSCSVDDDNQECLEDDLQEENEADFQDQHCDLYVEAIADANPGPSRDYHAGYLQAYHIPVKDGEPNDYFHLLLQHPNVLSMLKEKKRNLDRKDIFNQTALHIAVMNGMRTAVRLMVEQGADIYAKNGFGSTPLHLAIWKNIEDIVEKILTFKHMNDDGYFQCDDTALHLAIATTGTSNMLELLLEQDIGTQNFGASKIDTWANVAVGYWNPNYGYAGGFKIKNISTPLHHSVVRCQEDSSKALIRNGANAMAQDPNGDTPLHVAVQVNCIRLVEEFINENYHLLNAQNYKGSSAMHQAASLGLNDVVKLLITAGADVEILDWEGRTPLDCAKNAENGEVIATILEVLSEKRNVEQPLIESTAIAPNEDDVLADPSEPASETQERRQQPIEKESKLDASTRLSAGSVQKSPENTGPRISVVSVLMGLPFALVAAMM
uniref:Uncharacterized protein n=1 Tax=Spongospora subterranea TaxID=70186 RepID=A0A0H5R5H7_9EUKA|eukprot:CRZ09415.1 hypothetical protein [Spongospora subterranea]